LLKNYNSFFYLSLTIYFLIGIYLAANTGISHDEHHEQLNWEINLKSIKDFFLTGNYQDLIDYKDRYHGIGFNIISQPFQLIFKDLISNYLNLSEYGSILISKHIVVFTIFFFSGIFFYSICRILIIDKKNSIISLFIFYLYPYLFGHAHFNPKDIPFLSFWIICTYLLIKILKKYNDDRIINFKILFFLALSTAILISIRIVGILIFLQYLIFFIVYIENNNKKILNFVNLNRLNIVYFILITVSFIFIMNPIFWHNPLEIFNSLKWMSKYQQDICTLTLGDCMKSLNLPSSYYFIWLFFKLPILILFGLLIFPLIEKKILNNFNKTIIYSLIITTFVILISLIFFNVAVYDEIRHVMFLIPLLFLVSLHNFYLFNKKLFSLLGSLVIIFFIYENYKINPYQYTWMNSFSKFHNINKTFEVDYWGISNKNLYRSIYNHSIENNSNNNTCVFGDLYSSAFLQNKKFNCFKSYSELDAADIRPFYVLKNVRNFKRSDPKNCELISLENYYYSFSNQKINVGSSWYCD
tara:strand:- start:565 stop:2142 length:1578 start_codon:yes stop_codon:yes gene_type:complete